MSEAEGFLSRWSRRKRAAGEADRPRPKPAESAPPGDAESADEQSRAPAREPAGGAELKLSRPDSRGTPAFDLSKLPPIESITAETDIRPFLAPGVPPDLTRAALRRAWVVDPAIRDYIGLSEYAWDFTAPGGVPGFDLSPPSDVPRLLAEMLGKAAELPAEQRQGARSEAAEPKPSGRRAEALPAQAHRASTESEAPNAPVSGPTVSTGGAGAAAPDVAMQKTGSQRPAPREQSRRGRGRAVPT